MPKLASVFQPRAAPYDAEKQVKMPPMIGVDHVADQDMAEIGRIGDKQEWLPRAVAKDQFDADAEREKGQRYKGDEADPAIVERGLEPDIMRVLAEHRTEFQRPDPQRMLGGKNHP